MSLMRPMTGVNIVLVLVAGLGTRLLPATKSQPKEMLPMGRKPVVQYVVEELTRMVDVARQCGACANFAGSGGAVIGIFRGPEMYQRLCAEMAAIGSRVIRPDFEFEI